MKKDNKHHLHIELTQQQYELLKKIGSNINQIARSINAGQNNPKLAETSLLLDKVYEIMYKIAKHR